MLHRHFFARAMLDQNRFPFTGPYATSVLATYRSAVILQGMFSAAMALHPAETARMHDMWSLSLVCGVSPDCLPKQCASDILPVDYYRIRGMPEFVD